MRAQATSKEMPLAISAVCQHRAAGLRRNRHRFRKRFLPNQLSCTSKGESTRSREVSNSIVSYYQQQSSKFENTGGAKEYDLLFFSNESIFGDQVRKPQTCPLPSECRRKGKGTAQLPVSSHLLTNSSWAAFVSRSQTELLLVKTYDLAKHTCCFLGLG